MHEKRGKGAIVGTLGPASDNQEILERMIHTGLDVVRLNMSHGTHNEAKKRFELVRRVDDRIPILLDLSGPKIRIGEMEESIEMNRGQKFFLSKKTIKGTAEGVSVSYPELIDLAEVGKTLFLNDGLIELKIIDKNSNELSCEVMSGGPLSSRKGVNTPGIPIKLYAPTEKDIKDLEFSLDLEPDFYSVSFVRRIEDLQKVRSIIATGSKEEIPLVSKIEHQDAVNDIDTICKSSNGVMVARGDLGVELPPEEVPLIQRKLVAICNQLGIPCIVATQMLESMVVSPRPTRAETSDVANAILQGADAVMLSAETATGKYPVEAIAMMERIIQTVQLRVKPKSTMKIDFTSHRAESIGRAAVSLAEGLGADTIMAFTRTGLSSALVSKFRPTQPILAVTPAIKTARRSRLQWNVYPLLLERDFTDTDELLHDGICKAFEQNYIKRDSIVVAVAGSLLGLPSSTNLIQIIDAGDIIESDEAKERFAKAYSLKDV
ncbi:MAG: pyruvate kinase [Candidatus Kariarchaeaceae archaeon]|jgi:pyruvate kinase